MKEQLINSIAKNAQLLMKANWRLESARNRHHKWQIINETKIVNSLEKAVKEDCEKLKKLES